MPKPAVKATPPSESAEAQRILGRLRWYAENRINSRLIDERRTVTPANVLAAGREGLLGLQIEKRYGGQGLSHHDTYRVMAQVAAVDPNLALLVSVHNAVGVPPVRQFAHRKHKKEVLTQLASGRSLATIAASEPGAGSHVRSISTTATQLPSGEYRIDGGKSWISLGAWAGYVNLFARLVDDQGLPMGITGFLVPTDTAGYHPGEEAMTLGMKGIPQNFVQLDGLVLPPEALLGKEGQGLTVAQTAFMAGRAFVGALSVGAMKRSLQLVHRFAARREVATGNLAANGRVRQIMTRSLAATHAVEALLGHIATGLDAGTGVPDELFFACKILGSELMWTVVDSSVQLMGARGYLDTNVVGQFFRDYRLLRIFEGATEAVTVYVGTVVQKDPAGFLARLRAQFGETPALGLLQENADRLAPLGDLVGDPHLAANTVGDIACWAILASAAHHAIDGSEVGDVAADWALTTLRDKLQQSDGDGHLFGGDLIASHIESYESAIGDTTQNLPGEATWRDPLLTRSLAEPGLGDLI